MVIVTLLDMCVLCMGWWHTGERRYNSTRASRSFTPETRAKGTHCIRSGGGPDVLETRSHALTGDRTTIRNSPSPYSSHQTTPSWLDTVQAKRVLLQMKSQPLTVLTQLSTQHKWVNTDRQRSVMSEGTNWLPPCRNTGKHCPGF